MILETKGTKCRCDGARQHLFYVAFDLQFLICYTPKLGGAQRQEAAELAVSFDLAAFEVRQRGCSSPWQENLPDHQVGQKERKQNVQQMERPRSGGSKSKDTLVWEGWGEGFVQGFSSSVAQGAVSQEALKAWLSRASPNNGCRH